MKLWAGRFVKALARLAGELPPGIGALAGTGIDVDRQEPAIELGSAGPSHNGLDAVSDRDFVAESLFVASLSGAHLSRLAEDWIFYTVCLRGHSPRAATAWLLGGTQPSS